MIDIPMESPTVRKPIDYVVCTDAVHYREKTVMNNMANPVFLSGFFTFSVAMIRRDFEHAKGYRMLCHWHGKCWGKECQLWEKSWHFAAARRL